MKRALIFSAGIALLYANPSFSAPTIERPAASLAPISLQLDGIPQGSLVTMLLRDVMRVPYVIAPDVLADRRPISVRLIIPRDQVPERVVQFLRKNAYSVDLVGGTVYVGRKGSSFSQQASQGALTAYQNPPQEGYSVNVPQGSPLAPQEPNSVPAAPQGAYAVHHPLQDAPSPPGEVLMYDPAHRDPEYLTSVVQALLPSLKFGSRGEVKAEISESQINGSSQPDLLVMLGAVEDLDRARSLIVQLDRPRPLVAVKAVVLQMSDVEARGSALSVLASIAGGDISVGSFGNAAPASQFVRLSTGAITAMFSAVREDSRFKVVASPNLSALSGSTATINAGSQVPTVGAVVTSEGGAPIQSVVYRDSGITLAVRPTVRGDVIELEVRQERSNFVRTTTGVEDSPTLQKASASAHLHLRSGESVVLAGLTEDSDTNRREGIFGGLLGIRSKEKSKSELLVVIQADIVPPPSTESGRFIEIEPPAKKGGTDLDAKKAKPLDAEKA